LPFKCNLQRYIVGQKRKLALAGNYGTTGAQKRAAKVGLYTFNSVDPELEKRLVSTIGPTK
jgi:hypothetical protein